MNDFKGVNPGENFRIRAEIAGGRWKTAYRAWASGHQVDVALLCLRDIPTKQRADEAAALFRIPQGDPYAKYLPAFHSVFNGPDGNMWILEELLERTLSDESPLHEAGRFTKIARDLSRGLMCLHRNQSIHRDLKLDNCGLDHNGRAKIFDLGSVTSDGTGFPYTILTRAPEFFSSYGEQSGAKATFASDVWALGATLFALRAGHYPFVNHEEIEERQSITERLVNKLITEEEANKLKHAMDLAIGLRAEREGWFKSIENEVGKYFGGEIYSTLTSMLSPIENRKSIEHYEQLWSNIVKRSFSSTETQMDIGDGTWSTIERMLVSVVRGEISVTPIQLNRVRQMVFSNNNGKELPDDKFKALLDDADALVTKRTQARGALYVCRSD